VERLAIGIGISRRRQAKWAVTSCCAANGRRALTHLVCDNKSAELDDILGQHDGLGVGVLRPERNVYLGRSQHKTPDASRAAQGGSKRLPRRVGRAMSKVRGGGTSEARSRPRAKLQRPQLSSSSLLRCRDGSSRRRTPARLFDEGPASHVHACQEQQVSACGHAACGRGRCSFASWPWSERGMRRRAWGAPPSVVQALACCIHT
jgi:hypothetical protein